MNMLNLPKKVYFKKGSANVALKELDEVYGVKRAFVVSDANLYKSGQVAPVVDFLLARGVRVAEFFTISSPAPTYADIKSGLPKMQEFQPEAVIAVGGGSVISCAKIMQVLYENPEVQIEDLVATYPTLAASYADFPCCCKSKLVLIPTTPAIGAQNSPFAVVADNDGNKHVIASYKLRPEISITDSRFMDNMPAEITKRTGIELLSLALQAYDAPTCNEYPAGFLRSGVELIINYLEYAVQGCPVAIDKLANASAIVGCAIGNAVETINVEESIIPAKSERLETLAKQIGMASADELLEAVSKLQAL